jgi:hypothetical protein
MTTTADIRQAVVTALTGTTDAGQSVSSPWDWALAMDAYPAILVRTPDDRSESWGPNAPAFTVTATVEIIARAKAPADFEDAGSNAALLKAESLKQQILAQLINNPALWAAGVQEFKSMHSRMSTSSEGDMPIAECHLSIDVVFIQKPDDFFPIPSVPLQQIGGAMKMPDGTLEPTFSISIDGGQADAPAAVTAKPNFASSTS